MTVKCCNIAAIAAGGASGTLFRYNLNLKFFYDFIPVGTMIENIAGSFLLGCLIGWLCHRMIPEWLKLGLGVGFLGGFTTMSNFAADFLSLFSNSSPLVALTYLSFSVFGGIIMAFTGFAVGNRLGSIKKSGKQEGYNK